MYLFFPLLQHLIVFINVNSETKSQYVQVLIRKADTEFFGK